jgi:hypothetical protein
VVAVWGEISDRMDEALKAWGWGDLFYWSLPKSPLPYQLRRYQSPLWIEPGDKMSREGMPIHHEWDLDFREQFFGHWDYVGSHVFFSGGNNAAALEQSFFEACISSLQGDALLEKAIDAYGDAQMQIRGLKEEQRILEDRLKSAVVIVETVKNSYKEDYDTLYAFHHREYTPLPLWFKRLGQLVKVMTGKRTLKSLFQKTP